MKFHSTEYYKLKCNNIFRFRNKLVYLTFAFQAYIKHKKSCNTFATGPFLFSIFFFLFGFDTQIERTSNLSNIIGINYTADAD